VIVVAFEIIYTLTGIWEIQYGMVLGMFVILIGVLIIGYELGVWGKQKTDN